MITNWTSWFLRTVYIFTQFFYANNDEQFRTTNLHEVLLQIREKSCAVTTEMMPKAFGNEYMGKTH